MIIDSIESDLKQAMLTGDKGQVETLRGLKTALQYVQVAVGKDVSLSDNQIVQVLQKEAKKRQEAADLYKKAGAENRAKNELSEKLLIERYLPQQLDETAINRLVDEAISDNDQPTIKNMGQIIGLVKARAGGAADGAVIARLVKDRIQK